MIFDPINIIIGNIICFFYGDGSLLFDNDNYKEPIINYYLIVYGFIYFAVGKRSYKEMKKMSMDIISIICCYSIKMNFIGNTFVLVICLNSILISYIKLMKYDGKIIINIFDVYSKIFICLLIRLQILKNIYKGKEKNVYLFLGYLFLSAIDGVVYGKVVPKPEPIKKEIVKRRRSRLE